MTVWPSLVKALDSGSNGGISAGALKVVNGVDIGTLLQFQNEGRPLPPAVIRLDLSKINDSKFTNCDSHFFAQVLHTFPAIPHCHVHVVCAPQFDNPNASVGGGIMNSEEASLRRQQVAMQRPSPNNPFPGPIKMSGHVKEVLQKVVEFFESCPVAMKLQLSIIPKINAELAIAGGSGSGSGIQDDGTILLMQNSTDLMLDPKAAKFGKQVYINNGGAAGIFGFLVEKLVKDKRAKLNKAWKEANSKLGEGEPKLPFPVPQKPLYVNNINSQRMHDCYRTLYGSDDVHLEHSDIVDPTKRSGAGLKKVGPGSIKGSMDNGNQVQLSLPNDLIQKLLCTVSSIDLQHMFLTDSPLHVNENGCPVTSGDGTIVSSSPENMLERLDLTSLTHINFAYNNLGDSGTINLFNSLVRCGSILVHISLQSNNLSDIAALNIAASLQSLPRLSSINLSQNNVTESGAMALAESIGGSELVGMSSNALNNNTDPNSIPSPPPQVDTSLLNVLSVDLGHNRVRELGALRWAELVAMHPTLQFLSLSNNEIAYRSDEAFSAVVYACAASAALSVLDLRGNFDNTSRGIPPQEFITKLMREPLGDFDPAEVAEGVFIRRKSR